MLPACLAVCACKRTRTQHGSSGMPLAGVAALACKPVCALQAREEGIAMPIHDECNAARRKETRFHGALWVGIGIKYPRIENCEMDVALAGCEARRPTRRSASTASDGQRRIAPASAADTHSFLCAGT